MKILQQPISFEKYRGISEYFWKLYLEKIVVIQFAKHRVSGSWYDTGWITDWKSLLQESCQWDKPYERRLF